MEYVQLSIEDYIQSKAEIQKELCGIVKSFVRVGWLLSRIDKSGAYKQDGYNTIAEFAQAEYNMTASGVSRFVKVYETYSIPGDTPELKEQYRDFGFSKLVEMLQLTEEDRQIFRPEDKRETIRELQKFNRTNENNPETLLDWRTAKSDEEKLRATIQEFFWDKMGLLYEICSSAAYQTNNTKEMAQMVNPGDTLNYHKGTVFLLFRQEDITVKIFNGTTTKITWEQFFIYMREIFPEVDTAKQWKTAENVDNFAESVQKCEQSVQEEGIPGQKRIEHYPEYMPPQAAGDARKTEKHKETVAAEPSEASAEIAPAQSHAPKPIARREFIDTLTTFGIADYLAREMRLLTGEKQEVVLERAFWMKWLETKVDTNGREWVE